jgi:hypothetical protein
MINLLKKIIVQAMDWEIKDAKKVIKGDFSPFSSNSSTLSLNLSPNTVKPQMRKKQAVIKAMLKLQAFILTRIFVFVVMWMNSQSTSLGSGASSQKS